MNLSLIHVLIVFIKIDYVVQFVTQQHKPTAQKCENKRNSALVEHFFNVVFSEFQNVPPVCVCVQMCINQPTYCYPNGCLKRSERRLEGGHKLITTNSPPERHIESLRAYVDNYLDVNSFTEPYEPPKQKNNQPDLFQERYKMLFKYKKLPNVELRYKLREQAKNIMTDKMKWDKKDVRTRKRLLNRQQNYFNKGGRFNINYQKYFKRDVSEETSRENLISLDNFTQNLLQIEIDLSNDTNVLNDREVISNNEFPDLVTSELPEIIAYENYSSTNASNANENINITEIAYEFITENQSYNPIEINNHRKNQIKRCSNTSMEFMESFTDSFDENTEPYTSTKGSFVSKHTQSVEKTTRNFLTAVTFTSKMKSKQRIARILQKMKIN